MKMVAIVFMLVCVIGMSIQGLTNQELFLQGNEAYVQNQYDRALTFYQQIQQKSPAVWYNMGNAAYMSNDDLRAYAYWLHAYYQADGALLYNVCHNIQLVCTKHGFANTISHATWYLLYKKILRAISLFLLQILFFCAFGVFLFRVYFWYTAKRYCTLILITSVIIFLLVGIHLKYNDLMVHKGLVVHPEVHVYAGPHEEYHIIETVHTGDEVTIKECNDQWCKVSVKGKSGWLQRKNLEMLY